MIHHTPTHEDLTAIARGRQSIVVAQLGHDGTGYTYGPHPVPAHWVESALRRAGYTAAAARAQMRAAPSIATEEATTPAELAEVERITAERDHARRDRDRCYTAWQSARQRAADHREDHREHASRHHTMPDVTCAEADLGWQRAVDSQTALARQLAGERDESAEHARQVHTQHLGAVRRAEAAMREWAARAIEEHPQLVGRAEAAAVIRALEVGSIDGSSVLCGSCDGTGIAVIRREAGSRDDADESAEQVEALDTQLDYYDERHKSDVESRIAMVETAIRTVSQQAATMSDLRTAKEQLEARVRAVERTTSTEANDNDGVPFS